MALWWLQSALPHVTRFITEELCGYADWLSP